MKKNEYVSPEMEIVEITEQCSILSFSDKDTTPPGSKNPGVPGSKKAASVDFDEE